MTWSIYDPKTGIITSRVNNANQLIGRPHVPGSYQPGRYFVDRDEVFALPQPPDSADHIQWQWDLETRSWSVDVSRTDLAARIKRQGLFAFVDRVSPMWWAAMSVEQQQEAIDYRQAILDITKQEGYPVMIDWPLKPAWL